MLGQRVSGGTVARSVVATAARHEESMLGAEFTSCQENSLIFRAAGAIVDRSLLTYAYRVQLGGIHS